MDIAIIDQAIDLIAGWEYEHDRERLDMLIASTEEMPVTLAGVPILSVQNTYRQYVASMEAVIAGKQQVRAYFDRYVGTLVVIDGEIQIRSGDGAWGMANAERENPLNGGEQLMVNAGSGIIVWHQTFARESLSPGVVYAVHSGSTMGMPITEATVLTTDTSIYARPPGDLAWLVRDQIALANPLGPAAPTDSITPFV